MERRPDGEGHRNPGTSFEMTWRRGHGKILSRGVTWIDLQFCERVGWWGGSENRKPSHDGGLD